MARCGPSLASPPRAAVPLHRWETVRYAVVPVAADVAAHPDEEGSGGAGDHDEGAGHRRRAVLCFFALIAPALWFGFLSRPPMWTDEAYTLRYATSWSTITDDVQPPVYYGIVHAWESVLPSGLVSVRALSAAAFLGAIAVWAALARRWVRQRRVPWACLGAVVVLSIVSPHALLFGRMARYFGLAALALGGALLTWWRAMPEGGRRWVGPAVLVHLCLAVLTPTTLIVVLVAETLTLVFRDRAVLRRHVVFAVAIAALAAALVILLPTDTSKFGGADDVNHVAMAGVAVVVPLWSMTVGETVSPLDPLAGIPAALGWGVLAAALVAALRGLVPQRVGTERPPSRLVGAVDRVGRLLPAEPAVLLCLLLLLVQLVVQVGVNFTVNLAHTGIQAPKYFLPVAPALYLLVGLGVARIRTWRRGGAMFLAVALMITAGWGYGVWHLRQGEDFLYPSYALPWDQVVDQVADVVSTEAAQGHHVAVISTDVAFQRILAARTPRADILDSTLSSEESTVYQGTPSVGHYDAFVFITRQRINPGAETTVNDVMQLVLKDGFTELAPPTDYGSVDPGLRRLQELFSGRTLEPYLVRVVTLVKG